MSIALTLQTQLVLASLSGLSIGFALGLVGGGAGMLSVPLLLYVVKVDDPHVAIGTTAAAIAATALVNLISYARAGLVRWRTSVVFACAGVGGAFAGSRWSLHVDGGAVMLILAAIVAVVGLLMLAGAQAAQEPALIHAQVAPGRGFATAGAGAAVGGVAGFFGISGGFLSVPALHFIARVPMLEAVATSLLSVVVFGATTAANYAAAGKVSLPLALALVAGGVVGGNAGMRAAKAMAVKGTALKRVFATLLLVIAAYIAYRSIV
ncbi:sulfite exporter TauE/SafE family protein [Trinickia dinghuensis]|uniref:Probable membrane transporter protein n=1 Tax=Trinickia dinghuensis TaxID=2291023 RepID=A0A3D8K013_9BURK|nr:sulfite exporter TauE/SafE family protein [Trinickia dinghuensis]RDU98589.1 sulfite exporter TauE/SafE family protein [Trinickia dinghuensis]